MNPLEEIINRLEKYPKLTVIDGKSSITVKADSSKGFDVSFYDDKFEYTVFFEGWHEHFKKSESENAINCFAFGLSDSCRIKVVSRGGVDYKWIVQSYENKKWVTDSTAGLLRCRFWRKRKFRYLQNTLMKMENFYKKQEMQMNTEKEYLPDFKSKCISMIIKDDSVSHDLCNPHFEYQGGRLFIIGIIPEGSTESGWNANCVGAVAWDRVTDYTLFDDESSYTEAIKISEVFEEKKNKKKEEEKSK